MTNAELAVVMRGRFEVVTFDAGGTITARQIFGEGTPNMAFELPHATWHTLLPLTDGAAFLEIKQGPYNPAIAAEFAAWSPEEGNSATASFQSWIGTATVGSRWQQ